MVSTLIVSLALGVPIQLTAPNKLSTAPQLQLGAQKTYLTARGDTKPVIAVALVPVFGQKTAPFPTAPATSVRFRANLDATVVRWLQDADQNPKADFTLALCDRNGRASKALEMTRATISSIGFQQLTPTGGGFPFVEVTLTPYSSRDLKTGLPTVILPRPEPPMRFSRANLVLGTKPLVFTNLLPFTLNCTGTEFYSSFTLDIPTAGPPTSGVTQDNLLSIGLASLGRPEARLNLPFKSATINPSGPRRVTIRAQGIGIN
jgi:hypothetical protein